MICGLLGLNNSAHIWNLEQLSSKITTEEEGEARAIKAHKEFSIGVVEGPKMDKSFLRSKNDHQSSSVKRITKSPKYCTLSRSRFLILL